MNEQQNNNPETGPASGTDAVCTAVTVDGAPRENVLFAPPCTCANCAPDLNAFSGDPSETWLRMSGSRQRLRVENVELGAAGKALLG